ncbi:MAG: methyltransferase domain-containing protein [Deltaproteobacteria bacterium]|nr:methyltransferase domain-containing protein [Deltaproteobacteria bacterium]
MTPSGLAPEDVPLLRCPGCRGALRWEGSLRAGRLWEGALACARCAPPWPLREGLARLYREGEVRGTDRLLRVFYDGLPALHDPAVRLLIPLFQTEGSERSLREGYLRRMDLGSLKTRPDGTPPRVLEVGIGTGVNVGLVRHSLTSTVKVDYWGIDLSEGMSRVGMGKVLEAGGEPVRWALADAHALPFGDGSFDRVFHVGALGSYRDPARALAEMARVAAPGTPLVAVDEQLDPARAHSVYHQAMFRLVTFYDRAPHCPREHVPAGAVEVREEQVSRFFYCLSFRMPGA